jgi:hypothetical protein
LAEICTSECILISILICFFHLLYAAKQAKQCNAFRTKQTKQSGSALFAKALEPNKQQMHNKNINTVHINYSLVHISPNNATIKNLFCTCIPCI